MSGVGAIHHPPRHINTGSGYVLPLVHVEGVIDRTAVDSHPQRKLGMLAEPATNLSRERHHVNCAFMIYRWQRVNVGYVFEGTEMFAMQRAALLRINERTLIVNAQQLGTRAPRPQFFRKLKIFVFTARVFL